MKEIFRIYSASPEYPATCCRDEWRNEPRRSSLERSRVGYAVISLDTPQLAAGSFIDSILDFERVITPIKDDHFLEDTV